MEEDKKAHQEKKSGNKKEQNAKEDTQEHHSKKNGKGKKRKKGKGRGKKSSREASQTDMKALKEFLDSFRGTRRLMVRTVFYFYPYHVTIKYTV